MKIALISPIAWRTPPVGYGPWENVVSLLCEELINNNIDVTLFATKNSITSAKLHSVSTKGYEEDKNIDAKVYECLHISEVFENANKFDLIHNNFDFLPLTYSKLINTPVLTTIHGFSSSKILPVYQKYNQNNYYVSISLSDRSEKLKYIDNIYHGINLKQFNFNEKIGKYLLFFGRIHKDKGTKEAIEIAKMYKMKLVIAGIIQDQKYFKEEVEKNLGDNIIYVGNVGPIKRDELLSNAYALLHPISFAEPFGLSVVESMACGTPVIAFKKGSMLELIEDGVNGYLVDDVSQAVKKLDDISKIDRKKCREIVEKKFSVEKMAANYIKVYKKIIDMRRINERDRNSL